MRNTLVLTHPLATSVMPCAGPDDAAALRNYVKTYASHPNQLKLNGQSFVSTFAGEDCKFGQDTAANGWRTQFTQHPELTGDNAVHFVPSFFVDPATFGQYAGAMNGAFNVRGSSPVSTIDAQRLNASRFSSTLVGPSPSRRRPPRATLGPSAAACCRPPRLPSPLSSMRSPSLLERRTRIHSTSMV